MTEINMCLEKNIVEYLKENKTKGIAFNFMPKEVRDWCCNRPNYFNDFLQYKNGAWRDEYCFVNPSKDIPEMALEEIIILALPENFELKQESKGRWVEFDIDKNGDFEICGIANDKNITVIYNWSHWDKPIRDNASKNFINGCCVFGGWQYKNNDRWYLAPAIKLHDDLLWNSYVIKDSGEATPAIPVKIRFWREVK